MRMILAATDLSPRSDRAVHRAALLAGQHRARLLILHVLDGDQPPALVDQDRRHAAALLESQTPHLSELANAHPEILVETGHPFEAIVRTASGRDADLIVMGAHRRRVLRDIFVGTTIERVMRMGEAPVLMVNTYPADPYRRVLLAIDLSGASARAGRAARTLGFLNAPDVSIVHAFRAHAKGLLGRTGADPATIREHVVHAAVEAASEMTSFLAREGLDDARFEIALEEGEPFGTIMSSVRFQSPDLLVIGTHGGTGLKRILIGSVATEILRQAECDVLAVPPERTASRSEIREALRMQLECV